MKKIDIVELMMKTKAVPEGTDIARFCVDNIEDCFTTTEASFDSLNEARNALHKYETHIVNVSNRAFVITYVVEVYEADEDGEFVSGSDYDWTKTYILKDGEVKEIL